MSSLSWRTIVGASSNNVTDHPTAVWAAQQIIEAFPDNIEEICIAPRSPWQLVRILLLFFFGSLSGQG
jgi:hypothetical protein